MHRKPGYPATNCNIKMPDSVPVVESGPSEDDGDQQQKRLQLINFGHSQWGFNNWSWAVNKQDLDFVDFSNGKYSAGVAAFVTVAVKSFDIHRENVGYATSVAPMKGSAIHQARKCAVTNALRETLLSFGGSVAAELTELLDASKPEQAANIPEHAPENNQNRANKTEPKNAPNKIAGLRKEPELATNMRPQVPTVKNIVGGVPLAANAPRPPRPPPAPTAAPPRPNSNDSKPVDSLPDEEARAERKRRQRQAQEEFRIKQLMKQKEDAEAGRDSSGLDSLLMAIPTQPVDTDGKRSRPGAPAP